MTIRQLPKVTQTKPNTNTPIHISNVQLAAQILKAGEFFNGDRDFFTPTFVLNRRVDDQLKNPYKGNAAATAEGKKLYMKFCKICHGGKGRGDGIAGINLKPRPRDFTSEKLQEQTDGAIFWKIKTGRPPMAAYEKILKEEQRWQLVNYIRELGKN